MSIFPKIARTLLRGDVICQWTHQELYQELGHEAVRNRLESWLNEIELSLKTTPSEQAYFVVSMLDNNESKTRARTVFQDVMRDIRFHLAWLDHFMNLSHRDYAVSPGEQVRYSELLNILDDNASLFKLINPR